MAIYGDCFIAFATEDRLARRGKNADIEVRNVMGEELNVMLERKFT